MTPQFFRDENGDWRVMLSAGIPAYSATVRCTASSVYKIPKALFSDGNPDPVPVLSDLLSSIAKSWIENAVEEARKECEKKAPQIAQEMIEQMMAAVKAIQAQK